MQQQKRQQGSAVDRSANNRPSSWHELENRKFADRIGLNFCFVFSKGLVEILSPPAGHVWSYNTQLEQGRDEPSLRKTQTPR